ncbi:hypothetical protein IID22_02590 [Patescibacteria group bacterium]|nr:hypothetical protein [Patescibacteria group bacterium]
MRKRYSRLGRTEERKNIRRAFIFTILTIVSILLVIFFGLPAVAKFAGFLTDLRKSGQPVEKQDTIPPVPPRFELLPESTNELSIEIMGSTEPGATVILFLTNRKEEILANKDGEFSFSLLLLDGENTIAAQSMDQAGNQSQKTKTLTIVYDNDPPELEIASPQDGSEYYGSKQRQVVIKGNTEEGAILNINDRIVVVDQDGTFTFATTLSEGENTFNIKAQDKAGNTTEKALTLQFSL